MRPTIPLSLILQLRLDEACAEKETQMKRNHEDDLTPQSRAAELEDNPEHTAPTSDERGADIQFDEQLDHHRDPWSRDHEREDDELSTHLGARVPPKKSKHKRRLISAVALLSITVGCVLALYYTFSPSRSVKINVKTKQPTQAQDATAKSDKAPDDVTAEAIAEVRSAISNPSAATSPSTSASVLPRGAQSLTAPMSSSVLPPD